MEEQRISRMYFKMFGRNIARAWEAVTGGSFRRSPLLPVLAILVLLAIPFGIYVAHRHAGFHALKQEIHGERSSAVPSGPRPGGREPLVLSRTPGAANDTPEFTSVTLLPGLGMDVLQISASLPGRGNVDLLSAPTAAQLVDDPATAPTKPFDLHGLFEVPWGGLLDGVTSPVGTTLTSHWLGKSVNLPVDPQSPPGVALGGLLGTHDFDPEVSSADPGSASAQGTISSTDFDGHWISRSDVGVAVALAASTVEVTVTVKNSGQEAEPVGIGWHPRFLLASGRRDTATLRLPAGDELMLGDLLGLASKNRVTSPTETLAPFVGRTGNLGFASLNHALVHMRPGPDANAGVELRDATAGYGLRVISVSPSIHEIRVYAPAGQAFVGIGSQTNFDSPFGRGWNESDPSIVTLQPGQSLTYKVRLEIFAVPRL